MRPETRFLQTCARSFLLGSLCLALGCGSGYHAAGTAAAVANGPQLAYFWNPADQTLRPVLGIAGASQAGASVVPAGEYVAGEGASASGVAVLQKADGSLDVMVLPSGVPVSLQASTAPGALIRFSPLGRAALVFAPGASSATVITGLTTQPAVFSFTALGALEDAAVSDTGHLALETASAAGTQIQVMVSGSPAHTLASITAPGGMSFAAGDTLVYADGGSGALFSVQNASSAPAISSLATASLLKSPLALSIDAAGRWAAVVNSAEPSVIRFDLTGQTAPLRLSCGCTPTTAVALAGSGTFRITEPGSGPLWAADLAAGSPRIFFIPALP